MPDSLRYQEFDVPTALRRHIDAVWRLQIMGSARHVETVYPDGCCEIILHRKAPMYVKAPGGGWVQQPQCVFAGQQTAAVKLAARADADCIGVRLQPAASAVLGADKRESHRDRIVDLRGVDRSFAQAFNTLDLFGRQELKALWQFLLEHVAPRTLDPRVETAVQLLRRHRGDLAIAQVISTLAIGERTFQVAFREAVDLSAKTFARILKLQALLRSLDEETAMMSLLAAERGYSDQSHAIREARRMTGQTPAALREALLLDRQGESSLRMAAAFVRGQSVTSRHN